MSKFSFLCGKINVSVECEVTGKERNIKIKEYQGLRNTKIFLVTRLENLLLWCKGGKFGYLRGHDIGTLKTMAYDIKTTFGDKMHFMVKKCHYSVLLINKEDAEVKKILSNNNEALL